VNPADQSLLSVAEAARRLSLSQSYLNKLRCVGGGPVFIKFGPRRVAYRPADLDAWISGMLRASTGEAEAAAPVSVAQ
jgi:hypothetical protein